MTLIDFSAIYGDGWCGIGFAGTVLTYGIRALGSILGPWVHYAKHTIVSQQVYFMLYELMRWVACCVSQLWLFLIWKDMMLLMHVMFLSWNCIPLKIVKNRKFMQWLVILLSHMVIIIFWLNYVIVWYAYCCSILKYLFLCICDARRAWIPINYWGSQMMVDFCTRFMSAHEFKVWLLIAMKMSFYCVNDMWCTCGARIYFYFMPDSWGSLINLI